MEPAGSEDLSSSPVAVRRGRRAGRSKDEVLEAAAEVVAERGADGTRFTDVSAASGVPVSTLQYYFGNRQDLLHATFHHVASQELRAMEESLRSGGEPWEQLSDLVRIGLADGERSGSVWRTWVEQWRAAIRDGELREDTNEIYRRWRGIIEEVLRAGISGGRFDAGLDPGAVAFQIAAIVDGIGIPVVLADPALSRASGSATEIVLDAVARLVGVDARSSAQGS